MLFKMYCMLVNFALFSCAGGFLLFSDNEITKTVTTPVGDIEGLVSDVPMNASFSYKVQAYRGIPYAEAPTGALRFKKPVPKAPFKMPYNARNISYACPQNLVISHVIHQATPYTYTEDCLRLNVYVPGDGSAPQTPGTSKAVMVWIHGGGFRIGSSYDYDGGVLSTFGDVIVVTINYRLSFYGFLYTGDASAPGNVGLWDQHLAIKWVHDNIRAFGGDPTRVTIFGESAGSASVIYQSYFPGNKGLFQHAIAESGSYLSPWAMYSQAVNKEVSRKFSVAAGCDQATSKEYIQCLSTKPLDVLKKSLNAFPLTEFPAPVLDYDFVLDEAVNLITGKTNATAALDMFNSVDLMIGFNSADGLVNGAAFLQYANGSDFDNFTLSKDDYETIAVPSSIHDFCQCDNISKAAVDVVVHSYTDWSDPDNDLKRLRKLMDLVTDTSFAVPAERTAGVHTVTSTKHTYMYKFSARPVERLLPVPTFLEGPTVANHADELEYVFGRLLTNESERADLQKEYRTALMTMTLWSNFAKSGNPNVPRDVTPYTTTTWPDYSDGQKYLEITFDMGPGSVKSRVRPEEVNLWSVLVPELLNTNRNCN